MSRPLRSVCGCKPGFGLECRLGYQVSGFRVSGLGPGLCWPGTEVAYVAPAEVGVLLA